MVIQIENEIVSILEIIIIIIIPISIIKNRVNIFILIVSSVYHVILAAKTVMIIRLVQLNSIKRFVWLF